MGALRPDGNDNRLRRTKSTQERRTIPCQGLKTERKEAEWSVRKDPLEAEKRDHLAKRSTRWSTAWIRHQYELVINDIAAMSSETQDHLLAGMPRRQVHPMGCRPAVVSIRWC